MSPLERAVLAYVQTPRDAEAREVANEVDREPDLAVLAELARYLIRNRLIGPHDVAEAACAALHRAGRRPP